MKRNERGVVVIAPSARKTLEAWVEDVAFHWREEWAHREDHPYSRLSTFLGERFLTDFDVRDVENRVRGSRPRRIQ